MTNRSFRTAILISCGLTTLLIVNMALGPATNDKGKLTIQKALDRAIDDERHTLAFYEQVMKKHGEHRPFANIVHAERRHEAALIEQYERFGLTPPKDEWSNRKLEIPDTFRECCDVAIVSEVKNAKMYDALIAAVEDEQVKSVFENLQWASQERHLRAFRRHGSGWRETKEADLSQNQREQRDKANAAKSEMFNSLFAELSQTMKDGGPTKAIEVCATKAPQIAKQTASKHGLKIGRTSWKLRNQANTPPVWAELLVDERSDSLRIMEDDYGRLGVLAPIKLSSTCLQCHGPTDQIAPAVRGELNRHYPNDEATGFKEGDLRGWFWIEVSK